MNTIDRDGLKKQEEENLIEYFTPSGQVVRELYKNEFSKANWRKYTLTEMMDLVDKKIADLGLKAGDKHIILMRNSLKKAKTKEDFLMRMENFLLGGAQG